MSRFNSLVLFVGCVVEVHGGKGRESNQQVKTTHWCSLWAVWSR